MALNSSAMRLSCLDTQAVPLREDAGGVFRVGESRVTLDTVIGAFSEGAGPEEIALRYSALTLTDVYAVVTYYLRHRDEVDAYLSEGKAQAEALRKQCGEMFPANDIRQRLLARRRADT